MNWIEKLTIKVNNANIWLMSKGAEYAAEKTIKNMDKEKKRRWWQK